MRNPIFKIATLFAIGLFMTACEGHKRSSEHPDEVFNRVKRNFENPEVNSGVNCWWWWLNGNVNKAAITKDLEAMKSRNFHGAMIFDAGGHNQRGNRDVPDGPLFGSKPWNDLFVFALDEARRLGLEMGFNIQSGWNLGGPRVTPQYAAKQLSYSQTIIAGEQSVSLQLEQPESRLDYYRDISVLALPIKASNEIQEGISDLDLKLGFHELGGSAPDCRFLLGNRSDAETWMKQAYRVDKKEIINLSALMDDQGKLSWEVPAGEWVVLRIGYTCTPSHVSTSSNQWQGSVLDYMSKEAFDFYWKDVVEPIFEAAGAHVGTTLKYMETDSWECGGMNWTDNFAEEFIHYRGYDLISYLPIVAGYVVDDLETSNAFLADFRKTLADLVAHNHYSLFQEYAHQEGMGIQPESAGPHAGPMDGIKNYGFSDIVMSEFWSPSPHRPAPNNRFFLKQASSAAHIYGKKIVGAESFTTIGPHWNDELWHDQKSAFDHEICAGLNRMYFHTFTCSPPEMGLPGQEYFAGTHVNPQVTWWEQSGAFIDYMHRIQSVVQEGKFVADVLYYYGDHVPNVFPFKHSDPAGVMPGYDYDVCDETIFMQLKVEDGKLVVPGGVEYRILVLPDHRVLSLAVLEKLEELLQEGATLLGQKPEKQISLVGGKEAQINFRELTERIWGEASNETGERTYGKGKVAWGMSARAYLLALTIPLDFDVLENESKTDFDYIHYTMGERDIYFVTNQTTQRQKLVARFRVSGKQPELWDALSGEIREARAFTQTNGLTTIPLTLEPYGAIMVVFNKKISSKKQGSTQRNYSDFKTLAEISGEWMVHFDPQWGGPESVLFPELLDWTQHSEEGIRYYSGAAVYKKGFNLEPELREEDRYFLQLGSVKDVGIAEVKINGTDKGVIWTAPFRVEISGELQEGENTLEIKVVNSWFNRVAGDQSFPDNKTYTSTNIDLKHDFRGRPMDEIALEPSGLLGPVTIQMLDEPVQDEMDFILGQFENTLQQEDNPIKIPRTINEDGSLKTVGIYSWTSGFFAGSLWYLYELTQDEKWKSEAIKWTEALDTIQYWSGNHDVGFMMYCSYGNGLKFAGMDQYKDILVQTAESLSKRYNNNALAIKSWDYRKARDGKTEWFFPVIIDNMMNLELMFEASLMSGNQKYRDIALQHAETTMKNHYRDDSAAAITASALYELATYSSHEKQYKQAADKIVHSLLSPDYLAVNSTNKFFILNHSVGSIPHGVEIDVPLVYADYYLLEALYRKRKLSNLLSVIAHYPEIFSR